MVQQLLKQLGFGEKEITVYIAILQKGKVSASEVAKITGINRTTVYSTAKELIKRGVISEDLGGSTRYLVALPLKDLKLLLEKEEKELEKKKSAVEKAIKELRTLAKDAKYSVPKILFVDEKNLEKHLFKQTKVWNNSVLKADGVWWGFQDHTLVKHYQKWIDSFWSKDVPKGIELKLLSNKSVVEKTMKTKKYSKRQIKFWSDTKQFTATTWVAGDYLIMVITNQRPHYLVEIHDATLAHNIREVFKGIWKKVK